MSTMVLTGPASSFLTTRGGHLVTSSVAAVTLAALSGVGVTTLTNGSATIAFTAAQTLPAGYSFTFVSQPGVVYTLAAAVTAATAATLTTPFTGTTGATTATGMADAAWTTGPNELTFASAQALPIGYQFQANGTGQVYTTQVAALAGMVLTQADFSPNFLGGVGSFTITPVSAPPGTIGVLTIPSVGATTGSISPVIGLTASNGERVNVQAVPWATLLAQAGAVVLTSRAGRTVECVGSDRQPVTFVAVAANALVP
jgi:hypothetical protein